MWRLSCYGRVTSLTFGAKGQLGFTLSFSLGLVWFLCSPLFISFSNLFSLFHFVSPSAYGFSIPSTKAQEILTLLAAAVRPTEAVLTVGLYDLFIEAQSLAAEVRRAPNQWEQGCRRLMALAQRIEELLGDAQDAEADSSEPTRHRSVPAASVGGDSSAERRPSLERRSESPGCGEVFFISQSLYKYDLSSSGYQLGAGEGPEVHGLFLDRAFWQAPSKSVLNLLTHQRGDCTPCAYFRFKEVVGISLGRASSQDGCRNGDNCHFCHICSPQAAKDGAWAELSRMSLP